jgi:hypothetical protein
VQKEQVIPEKKKSEGSQKSGERKERKICALKN